MAFVTVLEIEGSCREWGGGKDQRLEIVLMYGERE